MKIKKLNVLAALFIGVALVVPQCLAAAFGVSPPLVENYFLKRGANYVYVVNLSTNIVTEDVKITPVIMGDPEVIEWVRIRESGNLVIPRGQKISPMLVEISIPQEAELGQYEGNISLSASSVAEKEAKPGSVSILLGGNVNLRFRVIDYDVTDYWIKSIEVNPIRLGEPLELDLTLKNLGNTTIDSVETKITLLNVMTGEKVATLTGDRLSEPVYAQTMKTVSQSFPVPVLKEGERYRAEIEAYKKGKTVFTDWMSFKVGSGAGVLKTSVQVVDENQLRASAPDGNASQIRTSVTVSAPKTNQLIVVVIGLLLVLIVISAKVYLNLKKRK